MNKHLISPLLLTMLLQACGGSSSSAPEVPVEPVEYTFALTSQLTNVCGVKSAFTDVELLLQDDTWQTLEVYQPDENGVISFVTESEFINYTIVAKDQKGDEAEGLNVVSYYQASSDTSAYYQAQFDNMLDKLNEESCECVTQDLELTHTPFTTQTQVASSLSYESLEIVDASHTLFKGVNVCRVTGEQWPLHSFSILGTDDEQVIFGAAQFINDFTANDEGIWSLAAIIQTKDFPLDMPHQDFNTNQIIGNIKHFPTNVNIVDESLPIFHNHIHKAERYYQSQATVNFTPDNFDPVPVVKTYQQIISTVPEDSFLVKASEQKPAFNDPHFDEIKSDGSYDYSVVSGYSMAVIQYTFRVYDPSTSSIMPAQWTYYGPEKGVLALSVPLPGYEDTFKSDNVEKSYVRLINSIKADTYQDYIKHYQGDHTSDMTSNFVQNIHEASVSRKF